MPADKSKKELKEFHEDGRAQHGKQVDVQIVGIILNHYLLLWLQGVSGSREFETR